jgi:hypothetical protein
MKSILKPVTAFLLFCLFIYSAMFTTSCNQKLTKEDSLAICNKVMMKDSCCSIALDCKGLEGFVGTHLYSPFIAEGQKGMMGIIIPVMPKTYKSYKILDGKNSNDTNVVKILKYSKQDSASKEEIIDSLLSYHTFSIEIDSINCKSFEIIVEDEEGTGPEYKKGRGKIIRNTSKVTEASDREEKESEDKK